MANSRKIAFLALLKIETDNAYSNITLNNTLKSSGLDKRDCSFVSAIFYGVLENKITLDYIISNSINIPLRKVDDKTLVILRMGVYQLLYMDKIPSAVAVNESVALTKQCKIASAGSFVNGVLHTVAKKTVDFTFPELAKDKYKQLSIMYSCPISLIKHFVKSYGEAVGIDFLKQLKCRPPIVIRVNTLKTTQQSLIKALNTANIATKQAAGLANGLEITNTGSVEALPQFINGEFHVQDTASQLCCEILNPKKGQTVIDVCSAPGGKAFTMAQLMENNGKIYAYDLYQHKINLIDKTAKRLNIDIISTQVKNAETDESDLLADCVLCDVPCSGLGIIRRKPEIRYKKDLGLNTLPQIQYNILCNSAKNVKIGGTLVYSTCTLNPKENGDNALKFLDEHKNFQGVNIDLPMGFIRTIEEPNNQLTLFPQTNGTDGFFISVFKRIG